MLTSYFGLIGNPLSHSFSADYFHQRMEKLGLPHSYSLFPIPSDDDLKFFLEEHKYFSGLNVTIPFKTSIIPKLDELDEAAREIGAVNTLLRTPKGWKGFNTDWIGFDISLNGFIPNNKIRALVLGNGGASKAVQYALRKRGIAFEVVSRTPSAQILAYDEVTPELLNEHRLVINTTPLGMYPDVYSAPNIPYRSLTHDHYLYDLVYNPEQTKFLMHGEELGAHTKNGLEMLYLQADAAWEIWTGAYPELLG